MNKTIFMAVFTVGMLGLSFVPARAEETASFSADMVSTMDGQTVRAKLYTTGQKTRMEMQENIVITRLDRNVSWVVMPAQGMYMEQPINPRQMAHTSKEFPGETERVSMGTETVDGNPAEKFKVTYTESGASQSVYQWIRDGRFPIKVQAVDGSWSMEFKDMRIGAQPDSLFEVPAGFQKLAIAGFGQNGGG